MDMFTIVPVFIGVVFVIVIGTIIFQAAKGVQEWSHNNSQPVLSVPACVVSKRTATSGHVSSNSGGHVSTSYFATFELESGERLEFSLRQRVRPARGERRGDSNVSGHAVSRVPKACLVLLSAIGEPAASAAGFCGFTRPLTQTVEVGSPSLLFLSRVIDHCRAPRFHLHDDLLLSVIAEV